MAKPKSGNRCAVEFKPASLTDLQTLEGLIKSYYAFDHIPFRAKEINVGLRAFLRDPSLGQAWLIKHGKTTAGYVTVIFWFDLEFGGRAALITDLYLALEHTGEGVSVAEHCSLWRDSAGRQELTPWSCKSNGATRPPRRFMRQMDFAPMLESR
jgi:hypothetical protein